jgi:hypothetical protein
VTVHDIMTQAKAHGITLWAEGGTIRYRGDDSAISALLPELKAHKDELLVELAVRRWMPGGEYYERIRSGWRLLRTLDGGYAWLEPGTWEGAA